MPETSVQELVLDLRRGATAPALLGALVEAGASLEAIQAAVATLGSGDVRIQVQAGPAGTTIRVRAPQGTPTADTWARLRPHVALLALAEEQVTLALALLDALFAARAAVHGVQPDDVDVDPFSGPDDLANALALAAATVSLGAPLAVRTTAVGTGSGMMSTIEGPVELPGPVVTQLLAERAVERHDVAHELVDPVGAAYVATVTSPSPVAPPGDDGTPVGRGRLPDGRTVRAVNRSA